jgi:hypothetical protein
MNASDGAGTEVTGAMACVGAAPSTLAAANEQIDES